jgi:hypothetical protein
MACREIGVRYVPLGVLRLAWTGLPCPQKVGFGLALLGLDVQRLGNCQGHPAGQPLRGAELSVDPLQLRWSSRLPLSPVSPFATALNKHNEHNQAQRPARHVALTQIPKASRYLTRYCCEVSIVQTWHTRRTPSPNICLNLVKTESSGCGWEAASSQSKSSFKQDSGFILQSFLFAADEHDHCRGACTERESGIQAIQVYR